MQDWCNHIDPSLDCNEHNRTLKNIQDPMSRPASQRGTQDMPPQKSFSQGDWMGSKIKSLATMTPQRDSDQIRKPREWNLTSLGRSSLQSSEQQGKGDRSRAPLRKGKGESGFKGFGKGTKSGKVPVANDLVMIQRA